MTDAQALAGEAMRTEAGEALQARSARRVLLLGLVDDPEAERAVVEGMIEAEDQGEAMARAALADLPSAEQVRVSRWAQEATLARCEAAARELLTAAESIGCAPPEPDAVALLAAGPACGRAVLDR